MIIPRSRNDANLKIKKFFLCNFLKCGRNILCYAHSNRLSLFIKSNERSEDLIDFADFFVFFFRKSLKILMHLGIMHFLSSIEIQTLNVT